MTVAKNWCYSAFLELMINISWFLVVEQNKIFNLFCKEWSLHGIAHLLWTSSHIFEVCFASLISWGHLLVPYKSKLHRLFSTLCHFTTLKFEPHHLPSEWCSFTSCLQKLDNVTFLQHLKLVLHHLSSKGMSMQCQSLGGILLETSRFCSHLLAMSKSWRHSSWNFKVSLASPKS